MNNIRPLPRETAMTLTYTGAQHREYMAFTDRLGASWVQVFEGDTDFYNAAYWDLMTRLWREDTPQRKTDALRFMTGIKSAHTAGKYVETALEKGLIVEMDNPKDARSKLLTLSPTMRQKLDQFFDDVVADLRRTHDKLGEKGPMP